MTIKKVFNPLTWSTGDNGALVSDKGRNEDKLDKEAMFAEDAKLKEAIGKDKGGKVGQKEAKLAK